MNKQTIIEKLRQETYDEAVAGLNRYGKFCIIRPTGFGKTYILTEILKNYSEIIYMYPSIIIKNTVISAYYGQAEANKKHKGIPHVRFISYAKLIRMSDKDYDNLPKADLIITDEAHKIGASGTSFAMFKLLHKQPDAKLLGATASPERLDSVDEIAMFFDDIISSPYTLHNAFEDGILQKPHYVYCSYGEDDILETERSTKLEIRKFHDTALETAAYELLKSRLIEISNLSRIDSIIRSTCQNYVSDSSCMRFIIFFASYEHLHSKEHTVADWFQKAYPDHRITTITVSGETHETYSNVHKIGNLPYAEKTISLIFTCDMLTMGYHVNTLTGIMFYRGTTSGNIYIQQLGRVLSSGCKIPGIVFDIVDNLHRQAFYQILPSGNTEISMLTEEDRQFTEKSLKAVRSQIKIYQKKAADASISEEDREIVKSTINILLRMEQGIISRSGAKHWLHGANTLFSKDLMATDHEATYRELIAKTVAEPKSQRCRLAVERWIAMGGKTEPRTRQAWLAQKAPENTPLEPIARIKQVSINAILDEEGIK